jgi:protein involved in sex pheromone biosynthesis
VTPNSGKWYYRIKAVGADGTKVYSNTLMSTTTQCLGSSVQIYPNPTSQLLNIVMQGSSSNNQYEIVDALGRVVSKGLLQNNTNNKVDVNMLAQGIYVLKVITDESVNTQQVYITR